MTHSFPSEYLKPLQTALGSAWPRPRVRRIMEDLENVQKRMAMNQSLRAGIQMTPKHLREEKWNKLMEEYRLQEQEMNRLLDLFRKFPATKEQFKDPQRMISECCEAYTNLQEPSKDVNAVQEKKYKCAECGNFCKAYSRIEREDWEKEYAEAQADRMKEVTDQKKDVETIERAKKMTDRPDNPMKGGFLITSMVLFLLLLSGCSKDIWLCNPDGKCINCGSMCTNDQIENLFPNLSHGQ